MTPIFFKLTLVLFARGLRILFLENPCENPKTKQVSVLFQVTHLKTDAFLKPHASAGSSKVTGLRSRTQGGQPWSHLNWIRVYNIDIPNQCFYFTVSGVCQFLWEKMGHICLIEVFSECSVYTNMYMYNVHDTALQIW